MMMNVFRLFFAVPNTAKRFVRFTWRSEAVPAEEGGRKRMPNLSLWICQRNRSPARMNGLHTIASVADAATKWN